MNTPGLPAELRSFLDRHTIPNELILVAFSGGPDSLALLDALHQLQTISVTAAHLNHQLRGAESDADEQFVRDFCAQHAIPFHVERRNVRDVAASAGANLESTARRLRYDWLARTARTIGASWVATGHTANDQAETVLHHLLRGTGLRGLRGIAEQRPIAPDVTLLRPLLAVTREEVLDYLRWQSLTARQDSSNLDLTLTRNQIRHELLPLLGERFQPAVVDVLARVARQATETYALIEKEARQLLAAGERARAGDIIVLDLATMRQSGRPFVREALHLIWEREGWPLDAMSYEHWERVADLITGQETALDLPGGIHVRRKGAVLQVRNKHSG